MRWWRARYRVPDPDGEGRNLGESHVFVYAEKRADALRMTRTALTQTHGVDARWEARLAARPGRLGTHGAMFTGSYINTSGPYGMGCPVAWHERRVPIIIQ